MGKLRAGNGHAAPYGVRYWQIGNELGDEAYQQGIVEFCKAMKAVDPSIKLLAAFPSPGLLQRAGPWIDYICPHHYGCQNLAAMEADVARCHKQIADNAPGRAIRLGITEWNTTAGDFGLGRAMLWTLDNALWCSRYHNFLHRHCDLKNVQVWTLADTLGASERDAANDWRQPDRIRTEPSNTVLDGAKLVYRFPALSVSVLKMQRMSTAMRARP